MNSAEFNRKVDQGLKKLNRREKVHFAWKCAIQALPYIAYKKHLNFWSQNQIYSIFFALDFTLLYSDRETKYAYVANGYAYDVKIVANSASLYANIAYTSAYAIAYATEAVASVNQTSIYAAKAANAAYKTIYEFCEIDNNTKPLFSNLISELLIGLESKPYPTMKSSQLVWNNFQEVLENKGLKYWANIYRNILDSRFFVDLNKLKKRLNIPEEIKIQGALKVAQYLKEIEKQGAEPLNEARIILLGDKGAGKTCLAKRLVNPIAPMTMDNESTAGVDTSLWQLKKKDLNVRIWDFAGHTVTHAVHRFFLSERCLYLVVYNSRSGHKNQLEYWLDHMKNYGGDSQAIILVNKRDPHSPDIPENALKEKYPILGIYEFDLKEDRKQLEQFRKDISNYIENHSSWTKQEMPSNYFLVKESLEKLFVKGDKTKRREVITREEFNEIAKRHDINDSEELLGFLHILGISLWYQKMEKFKTLVLNPEWISHGVYKIINWVHEKKKHTVSMSDFEKIFDDSQRYPCGKYDYLYELMKHYELAYETKQKNQLIIPHLLPEDRPEKLPAFDISESLMLRYRSNILLPPDSISRFIVRHNQEIKKDGRKSLVWRHGIVLTDRKGTIALVREENQMIAVKIKGQNKTTYLDALRTSLNDIFSSYQSEQPELEYYIHIEEFGKVVLGRTTKEFWLPGAEINSYVNEYKTYHNIGLKKTSDLYQLTDNKPPEEYRNGLKRKVARGGIEDIVQILLDDSEYKDYTNQLYQIQGQHKNLADKIISGVISLDDEILITNKIRNSLFEIIDKK